jgi:hypothetical protein
MRRVLFATAALALPLSLWAVSTSVGQETERKLLPSNGWGSLSGRVVYKGDPPAPASLADKMAIHADKACCLAPNATLLEKEDNTWLVDPKTKGVANVLIYLNPPVGTYFPIHDQDKKRKDTLVLDQPHCMFVPHVLALYPAYFDGKEEVPTGEKFLLKNSAPVPHNTRATGDIKKNPGFNMTLPPGSEKSVDFKPQRLPVMINCDIHPWMGAKIGVYNHPYFAITKADGTFTIPRVPAGTEVIFMGWHEGIGFLEGKNGRKLALKEGKNEVPDIGIAAAK